MSQFPPADHAYDTAPPPAKTSGLAVTALVCSLIFCCPLTTILGVLLGLVAVVSIGGNPQRKGKGLAIAAILLGLVFTAAQAFVGFGAYKAFGVFRDAPAEALAPGFAGDYATMRSNFGSAGTQTSDAEAQAFIEELRSRYGTLQASEIEWAAYQQVQQPAPGQTEITLPWILVFDSGRVTAELTFDQRQSGDRFIFEDVRVIDPDRGDLVFPANAAVEMPSGDAADPDAGSGDDG